MAWFSSAIWVAMLGLLLICWGSISAGNVSAFTTTTLVSANETSALQALKQTFSIAESVWPTGGDPCFAWAGVKCDNGHVIGLNLTGDGRSGTSHSLTALGALLGLPFLQSLVLSNFAFPGEIPTWFGGLQSLQTLGLVNSSLNGTIPFALGSLYRLQYLSLTQNNLVGSIPDMFGGMVNLTTLDMSSNKLSGVLPLSVYSLSKLQVFNVSQNFLTGPIPGNLSVLSNLQRLSLSQNSFNGDVPWQLGSLLQLNEVDLSSNNLTGPIPLSVGNLTKLTGLSLANNNLNGIIPPQLTLCSGLKILSLANNALEGSLPLSMGSMSSLVVLNFSTNELTGNMPPGWDSLKVLGNVDLSHNQFYGPLPGDLLSLTTLTLLNVSDNFFNETLPSKLPNNTVTKKNCFEGQTKQHLAHSCAKFYAERGAPTTSPVVSPPSGPGGSPAYPAPPTRPDGSSSHKVKKHWVPLFAGVGGGLLLILVVVALAFCVHKIERKDPNQPRGASGEAGFGSGGPGIIVSRLGEAFSYAQLQQATKKFHSSNLITGGHSGDLYKGLLERGSTVVVKRIEASKNRKDSYVPELEVYGKVTHSRLVSLLGYCLEREDEKLLVYKYMPNGDLASALHTKGSPGPGDVLRSLDWITRLKVAIGAAEALAYLHHDCTPALVHRDIKASSILLDDKFEVRLGSLSDVRCQDGESHPGLIRRLLGLSQSSDQGIRDAGQQPIASCAHDVYSYGKVLLELVSGKLGISGASDPRTDAWLDWAVPLIDPHDKESLPKLVDPSLIVDEDLLEEVWAVAIIAKACLNPKSQKRPSMRHVLKALENPHKVIRQDFQFGDTLAMRTSSHSSWNEALFGSWRHSSVIPGTLREEYSMKAGGIGAGAGRAGEYSQSHTRRGSSDIVPEPISENDYPRSR